MNANDVYRKIQDLAVKRTVSTPIFIDELAHELQTTRVNLISYLVDLQISGHIEFDNRTVSLPGFKTADLVPE